MVKIEQQLTHPKIHCWKQFIDDIFLIWTGTQTELQKYTSSINQLHNTIKFTHEASLHEIQFLDTTVYKDTDHQHPHKLKVKTYIKPTNKQTNKLYVRANSFHPPGTHKGIVIGEAHRYRTTNTDKHNFKKMIHHHKRKLNERGYPNHIIAQHKQVKFYECNIITKNSSTPDQPTTTSNQEDQTNHDIQPASQNNKNSGQQILDQVSNQTQRGDTTHKHNNMLPQNPSLRNKLTKTRHLQEMT